MREQRGLFSPVKIGPLELPNRIIMSPMTRIRAGDELCPFREDGPILLAAGLGWPHHHRRDAPQPDGARIHLPTRPAQRTSRRSAGGW